MEKFYNENGDVAVLYSPGYGAGWSTWAHDESVRLKALFDPEVVQWVLDGKPEGKFTDDDYFEKKYGGYFYTGGMSGLNIEWVTPGQKFRVDEYDGSESLEFIEHIEWSVA
jgi:hypothetical protein